MSGLSPPAGALPHPSHPRRGWPAPAQRHPWYHLGGSQALPLLLLGGDPLAAVEAEQAGGTGVAAARGVCHSAALSQANRQASCRGCTQRIGTDLSPSRLMGTGHCSILNPGTLASGCPRALGHSGAAGRVPRQGVVPGQTGAQGAAQPVQQAALGPQRAGTSLELAGSRPCSPAQGLALRLGARGTVQAPGAISLAGQVDTTLHPDSPGVAQLQ